MHRARTAGFDLQRGGGPEHRASILEVLAVLERQLGRPIPRSVSDWRPGDQKVFYSDNGKAKTELGWCPETGVQQGIGALLGWVRDNATAIAAARAS